MIRCVTFLAALLLTAPTFAQQYPTIVGSWYAEETGPRDCGTQFEVLISPMGYAEETFICSFDHVRRDSWMVIWNGSCNDGSGGVNTEVVALEESGRLSLSFNGQPGWSSLRRCDVKMSSIATPSGERVPLTYVEHAGDSPLADEYLADVLQTMEKLGKDRSDLKIYVASGAGFDFVSPENWVACGDGQECPIKIVKDGRVVGDFNACSARGKHSVAADGTRFFACETGGQGRSMSDLLH